MKITAIKTIVVNARLRNWIFVRIDTDVPGLYGLGEATLEFQTRAVTGAIEDMGSLILGEDPRNIEHLWQVMFRHPFFKGGIVTMSALSGIDQALHDLKSKDLGIPLWQLLGGLSRKRLRMYDHLGGGDSDAVYNSAAVASFAEKAARSREDGFSAVKILAVGRTAPLDGLAALNEAEALMRAAREGAGDDVDIMVDLHGRTTSAMAISYAKVLEPYRPFFIEEPCQPEDWEGTARVARSTRVPIAAGERLVHRHEFLHAAAGRRDRRCATRRLSCGRPHRNPPDSRAVRQLRRLHGATQPARADCHHGQYPFRLRDAEFPDPGSHAFRCPVA